MATEPESPLDTHPAAPPSPRQVSFEEHEELLEDHRDLLQDHQELLRNYSKVLRDHCNVFQDYSEVLPKYTAVLEQVDDFLAVHVWVDSDSDSAQAQAQPIAAPPGRELWFLGFEDTSPKVFTFIDQDISVLSLVMLTIRMRLLVGCLFFFLDLHVDANMATIVAVILTLCGLKVNRLLAVLLVIGLVRHYRGLVSETL